MRGTVKAGYGRKVGAFIDGSRRAANHSISSIFRVVFISSLLLSLLLNGFLLVSG